MSGRITTLALGLSLLNACSTHGPTSAEPDAGLQDAATEATPDAYLPYPPDGEQPSWDPVWHKKEPADWPTVGPEGMPSCGEGCRIALNGRIDARFLPPSITRSGIVDGFGDLQWSPLGVTNTKLLYLFDAKADVAALFAYLSGDYVSYLKVGGGRLQVELVSSVTGERKLAYGLSKVYGNGDMGIFLTALNSKYVFWGRDRAGLMARNLHTGEIKIIHHGSVGSMGACTTDSGIWLFDLGAIEFFDQETGQVSLTDDNGAEWALQVDASCAASRKQITWVDYRDPPGPSSNYDFTRRGGEVYVKNLVTGKVERVTFDSPGAPRAKAYPVVDGTRFVWLEQRPDLDPNPDMASEVYSGARAIVRYDAATKERCRRPAGALEYVKPYALIGSRLYGGWLDLEINDTRLVELDLDYSGWEWECAYTESKSP